MGALRDARPVDQKRFFGRSRGFTLMELMVVVVVISVFAALSVPSIVRQLRDRRVQETARKLSILYRLARTRAMGRGSAVLVRHTAGAFQVLEAQQAGRAPDAECASLPFSSCKNTVWSNPTQSRLIDSLAAAASADLADLTFGVQDSDRNAITNLDVCFTPLGRAFSREAVVDGTPLTPLNEAYTVEVDSASGALRPRHVLLMPNGMARLATRRP